jgi:hypothetical protein
MALGPRPFGLMQASQLAQRLQTTREGRTLRRRP